ncbi:MAG: right-handed parallel beta-helix repeat-containing protein [Flavobacteriales bacterium]
MHSSLRSRVLVPVLLAFAPLFGQPLNGTYTIGTAGNYPTFTAAVTTLTTNGISGPVTFNVFNGTYAEQVVIGPVTGTSAVNTITFQSLALDSTAVTLVHPSQPGNVNDFALRLNGVDHITVRKITGQRSGALTYGTAIDVMGTSTDWHVRNCRLMPSTSTAAYNYGVSVFTSINLGVSSVRDCRVNNGSGLGVGIVSGGSLEFSGNRLNNVLVGVNVAGASTTLSLERNTINTLTGGGTRGMMLTNITSGLSVLRNTITGNSTTFYGIMLTGVSGTASLPARFENNVIIGQNSGQAAINVMAGTCSYLDILHNSISFTGGTTGQGITMVLGSGTGTRISNNAVRTPGPALRVEPASRVSASDGNVLLGTNINAVWWGTAWHYDLPSLVAASGMNGTSLMVDPGFVNNTSDLHPQAGSACAGRGVNIPTITIDNEGQPRPQPVATAPDAGAYETTEDCTPLSGTYTIGPDVGNNFPSFTAAVQKMNWCGVGGAVTFLVQSGTYTEQIELGAISGNNATNTITFRSQANDSSAVILTWPSQGGAANNWAVRMNGADFVTWDRITLARSGTSAYAQVLVFNSTTGTAGSQSTRVTRCRLIGTTAGGTAELLFATNNGHEDSLRVERTRFENGTYGIRWSAVADNDLLLIQDNVFVGQGIACVSMSIRDRAFTVRRNTMTPAAGQGLMIPGSQNGFQVHANRILSPGTGVSFTGVYDFGTADPRFYNNTIAAGGVGVLITSPVSALHMDNNSIHAGSHGVHFAGGTNSLASFRNNAILSGNYTVYRQTTTTIPLTTNNALQRSTVGALAFWTSAQNTLPALQAASGGFAASVAADALYYNIPAGDLHAYAMELDGAGAVISHIPTDLDGQPRSASTPDMGADEFTPQLWALVFGTCSTADPITSTGTGTDQWIYKDRMVLARFNDNGQNLGTVQLDVFLNSGPVRTSDMGQHYLDRNWRLSTQNVVTSGAIVSLYHSGAEFSAFAAADPMVDAVGDAGIAQYAGANENCLLGDAPAGNNWVQFYPVTSVSEPRLFASGGVHSFTAEVPFDGEFYITSMGAPLPVELLELVGERKDANSVSLEWTTGSEQDNAGFEVWRMVDGEEDFQRIGWVEGSGTSQVINRYAYTDGNSSTRTSYYRLVQVDLDGPTSATRMVAVPGAVLHGGWSIHPNPATDRIRIQGFQEPVSGVRLMDATGREVHRWSWSEELVLPPLQSGLYMIQVHLDHDLVEQRRLLVR